MRDEITSLHGDLRMLQRAQEWDKSMTELWEQGIPCDVKYHGHDEARVLPEHGVVFLSENGRIVTVLNTRPLEISVEDEHLEEYLERSMEQ